VAVEAVVVVHHIAEEVVVVAAVDTCMAGPKLAGEGVAVVRLGGNP
jgi:hypothetical protein